MRTYVCTSERTCERKCECTSVRLHGHSPRARARVRAKIRSTWVMSRPSFCATLPFFTFLVLWRLARTEIRSIQVDSSRPYFRTCVHARPVNVQTHANKRTRPSTCTHTSVHSFAHVHSSVHSFALRSSPRPLATRTPYVHRVSWSYKSIAYEALKKLRVNIVGWIV